MLVDTVLPALSFAAAVIVWVPTDVGSGDGDMVQDSTPEVRSLALHVTSGNVSPKSNIAPPLMPPIETSGGVAS